MGSGAERLTGAGFKYVDDEFRDRLALRYTPVMDLAVGIPTVLIVHRIVLFWEPDRCFQDGGQENRREVGTYFITISSVY